MIPWEIFGVSSVILFLQQGCPQLWLKPLFHPWDLTIDVELRPPYVLKKKKKEVWFGLSLIKTQDYF